MDSNMEREIHKRMDAFMAARPSQALAKLGAAVNTMKSSDAAIVQTIVRTLGALKPEGADALRAAQCAAVVARVQRGMAEVHAYMLGALCKQIGATGEDLVAEAEAQRVEFERITAEVKGADSLDLATENEREAAASVAERAIENARKGGNLR